MSTPIPDRRAALTWFAACGASLGLASRAKSAGLVPRGALFEISLAQWSLHRALQSQALDPADFARVARTEYDIDCVEYVNTFYKEHAQDFGYFEDLKKRASDHGVASRLIMIDGEGELGAADEDERRRAIDNHFKWLAAAAYLGCMAIRVNAGGSGPREEHAKRAADSLHRLAEMGAGYGLYVIVENHGGPSSDGAWLANVMKLANHPRVGTLPDFGNFDVDANTHYDRYRGVQELMPFARAVSAKSYDFDEHGDETTIDYRRMLKIVIDAGYRDRLGIEYEGSRLSEPDGIRATKKLLLRLREELS